MTGLELFGEDTPSAARRLFFRDASGTETPTDVVRWWEKRRLAYSIGVGTTGLVSFGIMTFFNAIGPNGKFYAGPPLAAVVAFGVLANVFYTSGWFIELFALRPVFGRRAGTVGAALYRYGFPFSVGLTLLPIGLSLIGLALRCIGVMG
ncbi:MAG: hypothetical protein ABI120_22595 [Gemmatimonadaceae bacterium]